MVNPSPARRSVGLVKQLTGLDASFLYMETTSSFGHVSSLSVYEWPDDPSFNPYEAFRDRVEAALPHLEPFRRRLVEVPFDLDHPYWIADPGFDLDFHLRHQAVPPPGDDEQLAAQVARVIGRPMDRTRPLWEAYVFEGLADGGFAVLTKIHHATIDGASGVELLGVLLDDEPHATVETVADDWRPERIPSPVEIQPRARQPGPPAREGGAAQPGGDASRRRDHPQPGPCDDGARGAAQHRPQPA